MALKRYMNWEGSLEQYLTPGDKLDKQLQNHFNEVVFPIRKEGFMQIGEAVRQNEKGPVYLTQWKGVYIGTLNDVTEFFEDAVKAKDEVIASVKAKSGNGDEPESSSIPVFGR